ncbi:hypothetical protein ACFW1M_27945 [Streptomyces inhibens]|uniref:hypothetical protein n=1 Tax=Streptomyces inhibens TaxID=2293571 RepID=UPI0036776BAA
MRRLWSEEEFAPSPSRPGAWSRHRACAPSTPCVHWLAPGSSGLSLVDAAADTAWWLVSDVADEHLADIVLLTVRPRGWLLRCPPTDQYFNGRGWLEKPDGSGKLTDPIAMGAAFGPGGRLPAAAFG